MNRGHPIHPLLSSFLCLLLAPTTWGNDIPREHHPWGRFKTGSWTRYRVITEIVNAEGEKSTRVHTITTKLEEVSDEGLLLTREVKVGESIENRQTMRYTWDGRPAAAENSEKLSVGEYQVEGKTYPVQRHDLTATLDGTTTMIKRWYSPDQPPYILKELVRTVTPEGQTFSAMQVTRLHVARQVLGQEMICNESITKIVASDRKTTTKAYHSGRVPGALVYSESETRDRQQDVTETSRLTLEAFELAK